MPVITGAAALGLAKRFWKPAVGAVVAIGVVWAVKTWDNNRLEAADAAGFERARQAYQHAVEQSNQRELITQGRLDQMFTAFGVLGAAREQQIHLTLKPTIEGIKNEVASDPRYRECAVSDGVFNNLQAGRAAVDAGIAASNPAVARP